MLYTFESFLLDTARRELRHGKTLLALEPQVFDVLECLIRNRERVVSRDDLLASVWNGRIVSESTLSTRINAARAIVDDSGQEQRLIRTISRRGVRFVGIVHEDAEATFTDHVEGFDDARAAAIAAPSLPPSDKPSIAVLPFANMSGDPMREHFADGVVEEIITALFGTHRLLVMARNASFTSNGQAVDLKQLNRELGVQYVLEGSVRIADERVRITVRLVDTGSGGHLWVGRFDGSLEGVFELQDRAAIGVAAAVESALQSARTTGRPIWPAQRPPPGGQRERAGVTEKSSWS